MGTRTERAAAARSLNINQGEAGFDVRAGIAGPDYSGSALGEGMDESHPLALLKPAKLMPHSESALADFDHVSRDFAGILQNHVSGTVG